MSALDDATPQRREACFPAGARKGLGGVDDAAAAGTAANDFLQRLRPGGPWVLVAIIPDGPTITITTSDETEAREFVREHNGKRNIYYSVNPTRRPMAKKPAKTDIAAVEFLLADLDPRANETPDDAKTRYLEALETHEPAPTAIVNSGNGIQLLWRLEEPIVLEEPGTIRDANGTTKKEYSPETAAAIADIEARVEALMLSLGSNAGTQNIDRILRLPGTTNLPNRKKSKAGRVACPARLIHFNGATCTLDEFPLPAQKNGHDRAARKPNGHAAASQGFDLDNLPNVDVDALPVSTRIRQMIRTGDDPEDPTPFCEKRSERMFAVLIAMAAAGCDDATMAGVMFNPALPIGEHIREQADRVKYLRRQIAGARERARHPAVAELNETHALVIAGSRAAVLQEYADTEGREAFRLLPLETFRTWNANQTVQVGDRHMKLAEYWLQHPRRRQYSDLAFAPGGARPDVYNLWRGFAVEPRAGDCSKFLAHLRDNICSGNEAHFRWVVGWFAHIVQHPAAKCGTSLALRGRQGTGKTKIGEVMGGILGRHYTLVAEPRYITGRFNSHMVTCLLLHADEAFWAGDKVAEGKLKDLVTGHEHLIEFKGREPFRVRNYVRLFVSTNAEWSVPAGLEERRFAVLDVGEKHIQDSAYFAAIDDEMENGGREALLDFLLNFDLTTVNLRTIPKTAALIEQKVSSMTAEEGWWLDLLVRGQLPGYGEEGVSSHECRTNSLFDDYINHAQRRGARRRQIDTTIGMFLRKVVPGEVPSRRDDGGRIYQFPPLPECRSFFAKRMGTELHWNDEGEQDWARRPEPHDAHGAGGVFNWR
jgi:Family of unknown function (DUF5906)